MTVGATTVDVLEQTVVAALRQRLRAAADVLGLAADTPADTSADSVAEQASVLFGALVEHVHGRSGTAELWLLMTALSAAMPDPDDLQSAVRARDITAPPDFATWLLEACHGPASTTGSVESEMDVVTDAVVVDVDFSARHDLHTGIQRVVRETVPRWSATRELTHVGWQRAGGALRRLAEDEADRVLRWHQRKVAGPSGDEAMSPPAAGADPDTGSVAQHDRLVVPWNSHVVLLENPPADHCPQIAALARHSGNTVGLIGYDLIPAISPELIHEGLPDRFMRYLVAVKHAHRVAGISRAASREFEGFVAMLSAQGLPGPAVVECSLPVEVPPGEPAQVGPLPLVVSVGSFEPRKNQLALLHAAEHLWRAGLQFQVELIGGGGWATEFDAMLTRLQSQGRPVRRRTAITDEQLWATVRAARFTVFPSLHEGFGLPVAESLACGVPCLTSDRGSTAEIAEGGGALTVDPLDDDAIAARMRELLTDDDLLARLRREALDRPARSWDDYARELWTALVPDTQDVLR